MSDSEVARCGWAGRYTGANKEDYVRYHDEEWGLPVLLDDRHMFEMICLEGAQAGLSWATILAKRSGYKQAFKDFDVETLVRQASEATSIDELVDAVVEGDFDVVSSRRKIESVYRNAEAARTVQGEYGSLCEYIWHFTEGRQIVNTWKSVSDIPSHTELSERVAKDMKARGFRMVGPTTVYSLLQAVGVVNDHLVGCHRYEACIRKEQDCKITENASSPSHKRKRSV